MQEDTQFDKAQPRKHLWIRAALLGVAVGMGAMYLWVQKPLATRDKVISDVTEQLKVSAAKVVWLEDQIKDEKDLAQLGATQYLALIAKLRGPLWPALCRR